jgi:hypothetical protein
MVAMARLLVLLLLLPLQDPDRPRLVRQLGDADPAVRENAYRALEVLGESAQAELHSAQKSDDPEIRTRATALLFRLEQERWLGPLKSTQRPLKLRFPDDAAKPEGSVAETDGVRFAFLREGWAPEGKLLGTRFSTSVSPAPGVDVSWTVAAVRDGKDLPLETCGFHSPERVYVPGEPPPRAEVVIKGRRRWICDVPLEFRDPRDGDSRRIGAYVVTVRWPVLVVRADDPLEQDMMVRVLRSEDVHCSIKPGREKGPRRMGGFRRMTSISRCGTALNPQPKAWCGCVGRPAKDLRPPAPQAQETQARALSVQMYEIEDIESIRLTFHLPVEELFELTSPPLE